ncbi:MAG TPA: hypothetical protein VGN00_10045 [Puia sp.]|jgi:hypothetical protein
MFEPGTLYYFKPFYFNDGGSKPKYFLALYSDETTIVVATLPSSVDYVPEHLDKKHGCLNDLPSDFNAYYCAPDVAVTVDGWSFPTHTFLYGHWVNTYPLKDLIETYQVEGVDYEVIGRFKTEELQSIIKCFLKARTIKNKVRRLLSNQS